MGLNFTDTGNAADAARLQVPEHRHDMALELIYGADFWCSRREVSGKVRPNSDQKSPPIGVPHSNLHPKVCRFPITNLEPGEKHLP